MALVLNDRVKVNSTATGNSQTTFAINTAAVDGFDTFSNGIGVGNTTYYTIFNQGTTEFEVGLGTLNSTSNLQRTTIISSSNSDNVVDFAAGTKDVFCTLPASKAVYLDANGTTVNAAGAGFAVAMAIALQEKNMAQNFRSQGTQITNSATTLYTAGAFDAVIGLRLANITTAAITVSVWIDDGAVRYIVKDLSIPPASSVEIVQGGAKFVMANNNVLKAQSSAATSADAWVSVVQQISTQENK